MNVRRAAAGAVVAALLAASCSGSSSNTASSPDARLSAAEYRYGASPTRNSHVTYQPDVVIPGGGASSVRSVSADGLTWTLDGHATDVDKLVPGKILFVTNRGAGRVLGTRKVGGDVAVTIGPAAITDVIRDANLSQSGPLDTKSIQFRPGPMIPGNVVQIGKSASTTTTSAQGASADGSRPVTFEPAAMRAAASTPPLPNGTLPPPSPSRPAPVNITGLHMTPLLASYGFGIEVGYDKAGVKVFGQAVFYVSHPTLTFRLVIAHGRVTTAEVRLGGAAGLRVDFRAGSVTGLAGNIHELGQLPVDLSIPIFGPAVPLAVTLHQEFSIQTVFSAKNSTLSFAGDYGFAGSIGFGYRNGGFGADAPAGFTVRKSMLQSVNGLSVGVNGLVLGYQLKIIVGIGGWGFAVGPYFSINAGIGVTNGSDLGIVKCRGATFDMDLGYGIGYSIPQPVASAINFFLRALNLGQIKASGGTPPHLEKLIHRQGYAPKLKICEGAV